MKLKYFFSSLVLVCIAGGVFADKAMVEDFTDAGTWRNRWAKGNTPGTWFAASQCLSGAKDPRRSDGYAGVLQFDFSGKPPYQLGFARFKAYIKAAVFADGISFSADRNDRDVRMAFIVEDSNHKNFYTTSMPLKGKGWQDYRIPLNKKTVHHFEKMVQPVRLKRVDARFARPGKGEIYIDDIALVGDITKKQRYTIQPVYNGIVVPPEQNAVRKYLVRNGSNKKIDASVKLEVYNFDDKKVFSASSKVVVPAAGCSKVSFDAGKLPVGAYYTRAFISYKKTTNVFNGWFGIYTPNNQRPNHKPMYFGVQDTISWNGFYENELHLTWLKAMGIDIVRYGTSGWRLQPRENINGFKYLDQQLKPLRNADILVCMSYCESTPSWLQNKPYYYRRMPDKKDKAAKHFEDIGRYLKNYPNVQYFEFWNEPDVGFLRDNIDNYLNTLKIVYSSLKQVNPELKVTTGGVTVKHPREKKNFSRDMYQKGKGYYDIACFHAHGPLLMYVERNKMVEQWLKEKNIDVPLCNTETGERSGYKVRSIKEHAKTLIKKLAFAKSRKTEFYIWFTLQDYWDMDFYADDSFGLVTCDNQPKPAFVAYNNLICQLADTVPAPEVVLDKRLKCYHFTAKGNDVFVCWPNKSGEKIMLSLNSAVPVTFSDMFGKSRVYKPELNRITINNMAEPFYLTAPIGSIKPGHPVVYTETTPFSKPNTWSSIPVIIENPFRHKAVFKISGNDVKSTGEFTLEPGRKMRKIININVKRNTYGLFNAMLHVDMVSGEDKSSIKIPLTVNVAYSVVGKGKSPQKIVVDNRLAVHEMSFDPSIPQWKNAKDLSCVARVSHNRKGLKFVFDVTDDKHVAKYSGANIWRNDSIQLGLADSKGNNTEITISDSPKGATLWCHISKKHQGKWDVPVSVTRNGSHTVYKFFVPFDKLGVKYRPDLPLRMAFLINEDDGQGRVRWLEWFSGIGNGKDPEKFGWIFLE